MNEKTLQAVIKLKDQISKPLANVNKSLNNVKNVSNTAGKAIKDAENKMSNLKGEAGNTKSKIDIFRGAIDKAKSSLQDIKDKQEAFSNSLKDMSTKVKDVSSTVTDMGQKLTTAGVAVAGSLTAITGAYVEQGSEINKISKMAGMSTKSYQQWDKMLKSTGYSMEQANGDFAAMAERMAVTQQEISGLLKSESDLTQIVKELGLSVTDSNGSLKETGTFMNELMFAVSGLENQTHKQAVMTALLSTTGEELLPHLDNWAEKAKELESYSYIDDSKLNKVQEFKNKWNELKSQFESVKNSIGQALLPVLEQLMAKITPVVEKISNWISENPKAVETLLILAGAVAALGGVLTTLGIVLGVVAGVMTIVSVVSAPVTLAIAGITVAIGALIAIAIYLWINWEQVWSWISQKTSQVIEFIKSLVSTVSGAFSSMWEGIKSAFESGINWVKDKWEGLKSFFTNNPITGAIKAVTNAITGGGQRSAWGTKRVAKNDTPYRLHEGERVLTRTEADRYENNENNNGIVINISNLAVREEADVRKVASQLLRELKIARIGYSSVY